MKLEVYGIVKKKLLNEGSKLSEKIGQLKLRAKDARDSYEKATKKSAISNTNMLNYKYINDKEKLNNK